MKPMLHLTLVGFGTFDLNERVDGMELNPQAGQEITLRQQVFFKAGRL